MTTIENPRYQATLRGNQSGHGLSWWVFDSQENEWVGAAAYRHEIGASLAAEHLNEVEAADLNQRGVTDPRSHDCEVVSRQAGLYAGDERAEFFAICDSCGPVGQPQTYYADAAAIAVRHFEQGGFERRGA